LAAIAFDRGVVTAALVRSAIPRHDNREFAGFPFQRIESTEGATANDDFNGVSFLPRRGSATLGCRVL